MAEMVETVIDGEQVRITINQDAAPQYPGVIALGVRRLPDEPEVEVFLTQVETVKLAHRLIDASGLPSMDENLRRVGRVLMDLRREKVLTQADADLIYERVRASFQSA